MLRIFICAVIGVIIAHFFKVNWAYGLLLGGGLGALTGKRP